MIMDKIKYIRQKYPIPDNEICFPYLEKVFKQFQKTLIIPSSSSSKNTDIDINAEFIAEYPLISLVDLPKSINDTTYGKEMALITKKREYKFSFGQSKIKIYITIYHKNGDSAVKKILTEIIRRISIIYQLFGVNEELHLFILLTDFPRYIFPTSGNAKTRMTTWRKQYATNISSGITVKNKNKNIKFIFLTRREEIEKLLIHELIHFLDIDQCSEIGGPTMRYYINTGYLHMEKNTKIIEYEIFTEMLSVVFNAMFLSSNISEFRNLLKYEILWGLYQSFKLFIFVGENNIYYQDRCMLEYIFLRTILLININQLRGDFLNDKDPNLYDNIYFIIMNYLKNKNKNNYLIKFYKKTKIIIENGHTSDYFIRSMAYSIK